MPIQIGPASREGFIRCAPIYFLRFLLAVVSVSIIVWFIVQDALGWRAGLVYLSTFAFWVFTWILGSVALGCIFYFCFQFTHSMLLEIRENANKHSAATERRGAVDVETAPWPLFRDNPLSWIKFATICVGLFMVLRYLVFYLGAPCETFTFPGTSHPSIEIRYKGFLRSSPYAYLVGPVYRQEILSLSWNMAWRRPTNNPAPKWGEGEVRMAMPPWDPYGVHWSKDGTRLAISANGDYVGAYDLNTGEKIEERWRGPVHHAIAAFLQKK